MVAGIGDQIAGYRIDAFVGRGGGGVVYRATHLRLGRTVALKLLAPELAADEEFQRRFEREALMAARLDHPHIVPVYDAGEANGTLYLAMRFVEGPDLETVIRTSQGGLDPRQSCVILSQIASALDAAHSKGLVYHDVKPSNILIDHTPDAGRAEHAYLADFGLTRRFESSLTGSVVVGTPSYMAPERFRGVPSAPAIDVYALGCVAYTCLAGSPPFNGDTVESVMAGHLYQPPPRISDHRADLSPGVDAVLAKAIAKEPANRYLSCGAFATALHEEIHASSAPPPAPGKAGEAADRLRGGDRPTFWERITPRPPTSHFRHDRAEAEPTIPPSSNYLPKWHYIDRSSTAGSADDRTTPGMQVPPPFEPPPRSPGGSPGDEFEPPRLLRLPLRRDFRFVGGSLKCDDPIPFLGNQLAVDTLRDRIQYSSGGALLVTGFTGVGKTTVVDRALVALRGALSLTVGDPAPLVVVRLNVGCPITPDGLMVKLIRNLFESLQETGAFERLAKPVQSALKLAHQRTSQTLKEMRSETSERSNGLGVAAGLPGLQVPGLKLDRMHTTGTQLEKTYLLYTLADAEHDFSRIVKELGHHSPQLESRSGWIPRRRRPGPWTGRLVIVIDELDKLTAEPSGKACLADLSNALKNVFAAGDVHFVFVAGTDIFDLVRAADSRGPSVYDGVFHAKPYIPCLPTGAARTLLSAVVAEPQAAAHINSLCDYLEYRSRGLPRLLLHELNALVEWCDGQPFVVVGERHAARVAFFAGLQRRLATLVAHPSPLGPLSHEIDTDRRRIGTYLITDWALRRGNTTFSAVDFSRDDTASRPDPQIVSDELARELLEALASSRVGILERLELDRSNSTMVDFPQSSEPVFRLAPTVLAAAKASGEAPTNLGKIGDGRYVLLEELARGSLGRTYRAFDKKQEDTVTIKLLDIPELVTDDHARQRFLRRAELARRLNHPGLVRTRTVLKEPDGVLGIVMDYIDGQSLDQVLKRGPLRPAIVVSIAREILDLLSYLSDRGVVRLDLKPSSITLSDAWRPVVTELGLARHLEESGPDRLTDFGTVLGTPRYAAPEQLRGEGVDIRADLYSLGLVLYEAISGVRARPGKSREEVLQAARGERIEVGELACSQELRAVMACLLEFDRERRFDDPQSAKAALLTTPEAQ